jgi:hypothetical protein
VAVQSESTGVDSGGAQQLRADIGVRAQRVRRGRHLLGRHIFYDVVGTEVQILAIVSKSEAAGWLAGMGEHE